jgi:hypothetical protein
MIDQAQSYAEDLDIEQENEFLHLMGQTQLAQKKLALNSGYLKNVGAPCHLNHGFNDLGNGS